MRSFTCWLNSWCLNIKLKESRGAHSKMRWKFSICFFLLSIAKCASRVSGISCALLMSASTSVFDWRQQQNETITFDFNGFTVVSYCKMNTRWDGKLGRISLGISSIYHSHMHCTSSSIKLTTKACFVLSNIQISAKQNTQNLCSIFVIRFFFNTPKSSTVEHNFATRNGKENILWKVMWTKINK